MRLTDKSGLISGVEFDSVVRRFPIVDLAYETTLSGPVSSEYDICLAIPLSKKYFAWFSFYNNERVCFLMQLNREKKIESVNIINTTFDINLSIGTILYGSLFSNPSPENTSSILSFFIIEDILMFKGIYTTKLTSGEKFGFTHTILNTMLKPTKKHSTLKRSYINMSFVTPAIINSPTSGINPIFPPVSYQIHHYQYRALNTISPYMNIGVNTPKKIISISPSTTLFDDNLMCRRHLCDFSKPQYKHNTIFMIKASTQYDIYNLYASANNTFLFYDVAHIPNYKLSVFMNSQFRNIRENKNLDYIEESDDDDDFQNIRFDKYVNTTKTIKMECIFNEKFRRWIPIRIVGNTNTRIVHIHKLIR